MDTQSETHCNQINSSNAKTIASIDGLKIQIFTTISDIETAWDSINSKGVMSSSSYYKALEQASPEGLTHFYSILTTSSKPVAVIFFQVRKLELAKALSIHTHSKNIFVRFWTSIKKGILKIVQHDLLVVGNVLLTGQYGINFCNTIPSEERSQYLEKAVNAIQEFLNAELNYNVKTTLLKDFNPIDESNLYLDEFVRINVDPEMTFSIRENWNTFDDYLADCKSKYRVRYKRTVKKGKGITRRELSLADINDYKEIMHDQYLQISQNVSFNLFTLSQEYFYQLKEKLEDKLRVIGVFYEEKLIAFYTLIIDEESIDAHFLGYDMSLNKKLHTYHNMLFYMIQDGIELQKKKIHLSRTAMEIKSSVGAVGQDLAIFLKYKNKIGNILLHRYIHQFVPSNDWLPRSPFK